VSIRKTLQLCHLNENKEVKVIYRLVISMKPYSTWKMSELFWGHIPFWLDITTRLWIEEVGMEARAFNESNIIKSVN
jgi:hypothetical protein